MRRSGLGESRRTCGIQCPEMIHSAEMLLKLRHKCPYLSTAGFAKGPSAEEVGEDLYFGGLSCFLATTLGVDNFRTGKDLFPLCGFRWCLILL